ncbi:MAG: hypothetical protein ACSLE9_10645 [Burkholderiaceae bacterium]
MTAMLPGRPTAEPLREFAPGDAEIAALRAAGAARRLSRPAPGAPRPGARRAPGNASSVVAP